MIAEKWDDWEGSTIPDDAIDTWRVPHDFGVGEMDRPGGRRDLGSRILAHQADVVIIGPATAIGFDKSGTQTETREFMNFFGDWVDPYYRCQHRSPNFGVRGAVRSLAEDYGRKAIWRTGVRDDEHAMRLRAGEVLRQGRLHVNGRIIRIKPVTFIIHHDNRAGQVSGGFEPAIDTLIQMIRCNDRTSELWFEKLRYGSEWYNRRLSLAWSANNTYSVIEKKDRSEKLPMADQAVDSQIVAVVGGRPGTAWREIR